MLLTAAVFDGLEHAFKAAAAKATGHHHRVDILETFLPMLVAFKGVGFDAHEFNFQTIGVARVVDGFGHRFIGILVINIFAHQGDAQGPFGIFNVAQH